jgi:hypothetical protein
VRLGRLPGLCPKGVLGISLSFPGECALLTPAVPVDYTEAVKPVLLIE